MRYLLTIFLAAVLAVACNDEETLLTERDNIEKFLTSTRGLVAEEDLGSVIEEKPAFYTLFGRYAYRYIVNYYDAGREDKPLAEVGDDVVLRFTAYTFSTSEPSYGQPYWSNVAKVIADLGKHGDLAWSADPLTIRLGSSEIIKGLDDSLVGCREQDSVQVFMTSSMAYGKELIGSVPKNSPLAWYVRVEKVNKR